MPGTASHGQLRCAYPYIKCPAVNRCIDEGWTCDGDDDCGDASDENPAFCGTPHCLYGCIGSRLFQSGRIRTRTASELNTKKLGSGSGVLDYYALPYFTYLKSPQKNTCAHLFGSGCERGCVHAWPLVFCVLSGKLWRKSLDSYQSAHKSQDQVLS